MTEMKLVRRSNHDSSETLTHEQHEVLRGALAKIVVLGEQVGVTADQMIALLDAGLTVRELLEVLVSRAETHEVV
jgi:hypothetical protein